MSSFIRQKTIYCGEQYREIDVFPYSESQQEAAHRPQRAKKERISEPKQKNLNDKNARRYLIQVGNLNFGVEDIHVTATYDRKHLPDSIEDAEREISNFLDRVRYRRRKAGLPPLKYILVTAYSTSRGGEKPTRIHHHVIMNGGLDRDAIEELWRRRKRKGQKRGDKIGFINADRLQPEENGIAALCSYLSSQPGGKKRWSTSQNLKRPSSRNNDTRYSRREVERIAKSRPPREFWEKKYPGWTLTDDDYGAEYVHNDLTGWSIYLKLRRRE